MARELRGCPSGHNSSRVIGGPGTAGGPKFWAGCDHCNWRAWGDTEAEAIATWNNRADPSVRGWLEAGGRLIARALGLH